MVEEMDSKTCGLAAPFHQAFRIKYILRKLCSFVANRTLNFGKLIPPYIAISSAGSRDSGTEKYNTCKQASVAHFDPVPKPEKKNRLFPRDMASIS